MRKIRIAFFAPAICTLIMVASFGRAEASSILYAAVPNFITSFDAINGGNGGFSDGLNSVTALAFEAAVPLPAAAWLFGSALAMLGWIRRRKLH